MKNDNYTQIGGNHYDMAIQPRVYARENNLDPDRFNIIKYVSRDLRKNKSQDIIKAMQTCTFILRDDYGYTNEEINMALDSLKYEVD